MRQCYRLVAAAENYKPCRRQNTCRYTAECSPILLRLRLDKQYDETLAFSFYKLLLGDWCECLIKQKGSNIQGTKISIFDKLLEHFETFLDLKT